MIISKIKLSLADRCALLSIHGQERIKLVCNALHYILLYAELYVEHARLSRNIKEYIKYLPKSFNGTPGYAELTLRSLVRDLENTQYSATGKRVYRYEHRGQYFPPWSS